MGTGFRNPIFCQNQNFLCILDRCQTVGDHKCRTVLCQFLQWFLYDPLALVIQCGSCLIKNQNRWIFQKNTGYGKPLLLPSGELDSTLSDICIISIGKCHDKFVGIGIFCSSNHFFPCRIRLSIPYIFKNRSRKQVYILLHHSDMVTQAL